jgi:hypothetical protein
LSPAPVLIESYRDSFPKAKQQAKDFSKSPLSGTTSTLKLLKSSQLKLPELHKISSTTRANGSPNFLGPLKNSTLILPIPLTSRGVCQIP